MSSASKDHRHGHRGRLRERFLKGGADALADYELLELILMLAIPRRDVKPLAKDLIERFGSYAAVLSADVHALQSAPGLGDTAVAAIKSVQASALILARSTAQSRPVLSNWQAVSAYLQGAMAELVREQFRILFLDRQNRLLADEVLSDGTVDHTPVYPREVVRRALDNNATAIILVHNHPSGDVQPSRQDIEMTRTLSDACNKIGIQVHDHIIVGSSGQSSFRDLGLLK
ncbi:MAG: DNA repair protein RadC [Kordiimonadaceae bacterium]|nr:DNA repair protein RadC [Kordiimonadaceae bacterium]MBO6570497.1 DNA repair protein RadC [Kordiimonadaceae bacterium]MBO6966384.1 DNA repair protein RadC [Kordiimonadaceae bacterium]